MDVIEFCRRLLRCPSVTPEDKGAIAVIEGALKPLGFTSHILPFSDPDSPEVNNLYARLGTESPHFCFAGHTDVVPAGNISTWSFDPFEGKINGGILYGRGAVDMKGAIACFIAALTDFLQDKGHAFKGSISLMITGDEEGPAVNGTRKILGWLENRNETIDACLIGEPSSNKWVVDTIKTGRRGSLNVEITVHGSQGHAAYPELACNPIPRLLGFLTEISKTPLDQGSDIFQPSHLEMTSIDVGNTATNIIPQDARARFNIRFNDHHRGETLIKWLHDIAQKIAKTYTLTTYISGEPFYVRPCPFKNIVVNAVKDVTGYEPQVSTSGGTSDGRFINAYAPVIECGLKNAAAHKVDEHVALEDLQTLKEIYRRILERFFR